MHDLSRGARTVFGHVRLVAGGGTLLLAAVAWVQLLRMGPASGGVALAPRMEPWATPDVVALAVMWTVMMVAMMAPSVAPVVVAYAAVARGRKVRGVPRAPAAVFLSGYLAVWLGFSVAAAVAQFGLHEAALLSPAMVVTSPLLGGVLLVAAGLFQWSSLKTRCLARCRSPLAFVLAEWREGIRGAVTMGARHGVYCVGCCWALMALLFVAGVMNVVWVAAIAAFVLIEKLAPAGLSLGRVAGLVLVAAGVALATLG